jgi:hypothetical protein
VRILVEFEVVEEKKIEKLYFCHCFKYQIDWQHFKHLLIVLSSYFNNCCIGQTKACRFVPIIIYMSVLSFPGRYYKCPSLMAISPRPPYDKPIHFSALYTVLCYTCYPLVRRLASWDLSSIIIILYWSIFSHRNTMDLHCEVISTNFTICLDVYENCI